MSFVCIYTVVADGVLEPRFASLTMSVFSVKVLMFLEAVTRTITCLAV